MMRIIQTYRFLILLMLLSLLVACQAGAYSAANLNRLNPLLRQQKAIAKTSFTLLQANIGNVDPLCSLYARSKLCHQDIENRIAQSIQRLQPDIVSLQEVLPDWICRQGKLAAQGQVCQNYQTRPVRDQARRLLGTHYTIVCEPHHSWDCIGVRNGFASVQPDAQGHSCPPGGLCGTERLSAGDRQGGNRDSAYHPYYAQTIESHLDDGFHVMSLDLLIKGVPVRLVNGHPQSGHKSSEQEARAKQINQMFETFAKQPQTLIAGDLNLDPFRQNDRSAQTLNQFVDNYGSKGQLIASRAFHYHSGPVEQPSVWPPRLTAQYLWPLPSGTLDHVLSNFAGGTCRTLDAADHLSAGKGTDHKALFCQLGF